MTAPLSINAQPTTKVDARDSCNDCITCKSSCCPWRRKVKHHHKPTPETIKPTAAFKKEFSEQ